MLKNCIPRVFANTKQIAEIFAAEQPELDQVQTEIRGWISDLHILSSSENGIARWEDDFALDHNTDLTLQQRRARVFAKKKQRDLPKLEFMRQVISNLLNGKNIIIVEENCEFQIYAESADLIDTFAIAENFVRKVRPAHWGFRFINAIPRQYNCTVYAGHATFEHKKFTMEVAE